MTQSSPTPPPSHHPPPIESLLITHRTTSLLQQCLSKLHHLTSNDDNPPVDILQYRDDLITSPLVLQNHSDLQKHLTYQRDLERRYDELTLRRGHLKVLENKTEYKSVADEILNVTRLLRESTKGLQRKLRECDVVDGNIVKIREDIKNVMEVIKTTIGEIRGDDNHDENNNNPNSNNSSHETTNTNTNINTTSSMTFPTLRKTVTGYISIEKRMQTSKSTERDLTESLTTLKRDIRRATDNHDAKENELKDEIDRLTMELMLLKKGTDVENFEAEVEAKIEAEILLLRQEERRLRCDVESIKETTSRERAVHATTASHLQKKITTIAKNRHRWKEKYNNDMSKKEMELAKVTNERDANLDLLVKLRRRKEREGREEMERRERMRLERERKREVEREEERRHFAAMLIQRKGKEFLKRPKAKVGGGGGGGKGKKGKKGKKKK